MDLKELRNKIEGPTLVRYAGAIAGVLMALFALYDMMHIFAEMQHPNAFIIKVYAACAGIAILVVEMKNVDGFQKLREFYYKWMPFLTIMAGKGVFYLFAGSLSLSFMSDMKMFLPGAVVASIGVLYLLMHFGQCHKLAEAYQQHETVYMRETVAIP